MRETAAPLRRSKTKVYFNNGKQRERHPPRAGHGGGGRNVKYTTKDDYAVIAMVEQGLGISIMPELLLMALRTTLLMPLDNRASRIIGAAKAGEEQRQRHRAEVHCAHALDSRAIRATRGIIYYQPACL